jgi:spectrin beta
MQLNRLLKYKVSAAATTSRRTPSFTTRRAVSVRKVRAWDELAAIDKHGYLERKHELQSTGKRAAVRSWKTYYTILCGQLVAFFKVVEVFIFVFTFTIQLQDEEAFMENTAAAPPVYILHAQCMPCTEYVKRKCVFKLRAQVHILSCKMVIFTQIVL